MANILDYLETEFETFEQRPFCTVDSLVLSSLCMIRLEGIVDTLDIAKLRGSADPCNSADSHNTVDSSREEASPHVGDGSMGKFLNSMAKRAARAVQTLAVSGKMSDKASGKESGKASSKPAEEQKVHFKDLLLAERYPEMFIGLVPEKTKRLLIAAAASPRFRDIELKEYATLFNQEESTQFAAVSFVYKDQFSYVGFRGTDGSFTGWREDFDMAYMDSIPSQSQALRYLDMVAGDLPGTLFVGGHSKGGNLAAYATALCSPEVFSRIKTCFCHDGPGMRSGSLGIDQAIRLAKVMDKTVPQDSVIGLLLDNAPGYRVVKSNGKGLSQHDPFTWELDGCDLVAQEGVTASAAYVDRVLDVWLGMLSCQEAKEVVDALFDLMEASGAQDFAELINGSAKTLQYLKTMAAQSDGPEKASLVKAAKTLGEAAIQVARGK